MNSRFSLIKESRLTAVVFANLGLTTMVSEKELLCNAIIYPNLDGLVDQHRPCNKNGKTYARPNTQRLLSCPAGPALMEISGPLQSEKGIIYPC